MSSAAEAEVKLEVEWEAKSPDTNQQEEGGGGKEEDREQQQQEEENEVQVLEQEEEGQEEHHDEHEESEEGSDNGAEDYDHPSLKNKKRKKKENHGVLPEGKKAKQKDDNDKCISISSSAHDVDDEWQEMFLAPTPPPRPTPGHPKPEANSKLQLNAHYTSFIALRSALERYQKENHVQLVVKDSKLLSAESTRKIIKKVYHLVNQNLMYHSITYVCKCHGSLKQKPGSRIKNVGAKRLNCPVYLRFKLSSDLTSLVLFNWYQSHNHPTDPNTFELSPRQQVYRLTRMQRGEPDPVQCEQEILAPTEAHKPSMADVQALIVSAIKDVNCVASLTETDYQPSVCGVSTTQDNITARPKVKQPFTDHDYGIGNEYEDTESEKGDNEADSDTEMDNIDNKDDVYIDNDDDSDEEWEEEENIFIHKDISNSPLDPESSCSDSDEEDFRKNRHLLSYPIRLIGSAVQCSPELISLTKELIETQKENLQIERRKLLLETKQLELQNAKLSLEVKDLQKNITAASGTDNTTTVYLQG